MAWHTLTSETAAQRLDTDLRRGLSTSAAAARLARDGPNVLELSADRPWWRLLLQQVRSLIVLLLVAAACVALLLGDRIEAMAILVVIVLNAAIGFVTESGAQRALAALREHAAQVARVIRDGVMVEAPARTLVTGDLVVLEAGAIVPADGRLVTAERLQVDEAILTGESQSVHKSVAPLDSESLPVGDRVNMAFTGTAVVDGRGMLLVTGTGRQTEMGQIGTLVAEAVAPTSTPLDRELNRLGRLLIVVVLSLCAGIALLGWLRGIDGFWPMMELAMSLAIAAVPEGLPAVATMTLAIGMQRMARKRALIRRLPAVETLGSTTVICTDKTGTLTRNEMTVTSLALAERRITVSGAGYAHDGVLQENGATVPSHDDALQAALRIAALCNDASVELVDGEHRVLGDPTEAALLVLARKGGADPEVLRREYPRVAELPFSAELRRMTTLHRAPDGGVVALVKGSPGTLLQQSRHEQRADGVHPLDAAARERWLGVNKELAGGALRVLGLAWREVGEHYREEELCRDLVFAGLVGMLDPLREEARPAIEVCRRAGIRVLMLTGDQLETATEIGRQLGIDRDPAGAALRAIHARELGSGDPASVSRAIVGVSVFARISPAHKLQIIAALQQQGEVVAMTGDGVNDAPALQQADIGVAMGIKGTDVARAASDMVLTDDNFASIAGAVEQGRVVHANIVRFIQYLFSCNLSELLVVTIAIVVGWPLPLAALQILWLNMITDVFPAMALALEPSDPWLMQQPPRIAQAPLLSAPLIRRIFWQGALLAVATLLAFTLGLSWHGREGEGLPRATTMAFMTLALAQVVHVFSARSATASALGRGLFRNRWIWAAVATCVVLQWLAVSLPVLRRVLGTVMPTIAEWQVILGCALLPLAVVELVKVVRRLGAGSTRRSMR